MALALHGTSTWLKIAGAWCGSKRKQKGAASFTVKDRKSMLEDFQARDYEDVVTTAMERLLVDCHLDMCKPL